MQNVSFIGRLTRNPESFTYKAGKGQIAKFSIAVTHTHGKKNPQTGKWEGETSAFITVKAFDRDKYGLGTICLERLEQGDRVAVQGRFMTETWEKDGKRNYALVLTADSVEFLERSARPPREENRNEKGTKGQPIPATEEPNEEDNLVDKIPF